MNYWKIKYMYNTYIVPAVKAHTAVARAMRNHPNKTKGRLEFEQVTKADYDALQEVTE